MRETHTARLTDPEVTACPYALIHWVFTAAAQVYAGVPRPPPDRPPIVIILLQPCGGSSTG